MINFKRLFFNKLQNYKNFSESWSVKGNNCQFFKPKYYIPMKSL